MTVRQRAGKLAKDAGTTFEMLFEAHCNRHQIGFVKIPDGCRRVRTSWGVKLVPVRTPFDFVICKQGMAAALDCKTINKTRFSYTALDLHQLEALAKISAHIVSGYIIWYRESDRVCFYTIEELRALKIKTSLKDSEGLYLGRAEDLDPSLILNLRANHISQGVLI
jgi:hypothetical protein